jgi:predicted alpha/beta hydrolase family esterase
LIASETDPWMRLSTAETWASIWGAEFQNLGPVGHINAESGFGPLPAAETFIAEHVEGLATAAPRAPAKAPLHHAAHVS